MEQLAWSDGSKPERSKKSDKSKFKRNNPEETSTNKLFSINQTGILRQSNTKREDANLKISEREMVGQTCQNPFFYKRSYVEDIEIQQNFLIPQSSHEQSN
tara:strand:+ start:1179 stop:1481 length:303 start_codon:yes stop_codon:yes gene_type:complete